MAARPDADRTSIGRMPRTLSEARTHRNALGMAVVLVLPAVVLLVTPVLVMQAGSLDPEIYTAYSHNFKLLIERYGRTYYSMRIAHIFPANLLTQIFGSELGYLVHRYLMLAVVTASVWALALRYFGLAVAFAATVATLFSPWLLRSIFWDYIDSSAVTYLFGMQALLLLGAGVAFRTHWRTTLAGVLLCLAGNSNTFALGIGGLAFAATFAVTAPRVRLRNWLAAGLLSVLAFLATYAVLVVLRFAIVSQEGLVLDQFAFATSRALIGGQGAVWHVPVLPLVAAGNYQLLLPVAAALIGGVLLYSGRIAGGDGKTRLFLAAAALYASLITMLYVVIDFGFRVAVISLSYYFIYAMPATYLVLIGALGSAALGCGRAWRTALAAFVALATLASFLLFRPLAPLILSIDWHFYAVVALLLIASAMLPRWSCPAALAAASLALAAVPFTFYASPTFSHFYARMHTATESEREWDVRAATVALIHFIDGHPVRPSNVAFWYTNEPSHFLNSVQSAYLWGYSRLHSTDTSVPGMPTMQPQDLGRLRHFDYLTLLAESPIEIAAAKASLLRHGVAFETLKKDYFAGRALNAYFDLLKLER